MLLVNSLNLEVLIRFIQVIKISSIYDLIGSITNLYLYYLSIEIKINVRPVTCLHLYAWKPVCWGLNWIRFTPDVRAGGRFSSASDRFSCKLPKVVHI